MNRPSTPSPADVGERWFSADRVASSDRMRGLVDETCDLYRSHVRPRRWRRETARKIEAVISNLAHAKWTGGRALKVRLDPLYYSRNATRCYRHPEVETKTFPAVLSSMEDVGLIRLDRRHMMARNAGGGVSRMEAAGRLADLLNGFADLGPADISRDYGSSPILLKDDAGKRLDYALTPETRGFTSRVRSLNEWISGFALSIWREPDEERAAWSDVSDTSLHRVFTHGSFERHGRLYGGFWIGTPRAERWRIAIEGEPLVQLDFAAMFLSLLYAGTGVTMPAGDPYALPAVEGVYRGRGLSEADARAAARRAVKTMVSARLFDQGERTRYPKPEPKDPLDYWPDPKRELKAKAMLAAIEARHPEIASSFGTGIGHTLFFEESEIILGALEGCRANDIPALPIHDALLVRQRDYKRAGELMAEAFETRAHAWPVIKAKRLADPMESLFLRDAEIEAAEVELRSRDGKQRPRWSGSLPTDVLGRYQLRNGEPAVKEAMARSYASTRASLLPASPPPLDRFSPHDELLMALARAEHWMMERCDYAALDPSERTGADEQIKRHVDRCLQACVMRMPVEYLRVLAGELNRAGLLDAGWESVSPHSIKASAIA